jgi:hypothetical protein
MKYYTNFILTVVAFLLAFNIFGTHDFEPNSADVVDKRTGKIYFISEGKIIEISLQSGKRLIKNITDTAKPANSDLLKNLPDKAESRGHFVPDNPQ